MNLLLLYLFDLTKILILVSSSPSSSSYIKILNLFL